MRGSYLSGKVIGGLLGAGTWPGAAVHDVELVLDIFPFLPELEQVL